MEHLLRRYVSRSSSLLLKPPFGELEYAYQSLCVNVGRFCDGGLGSFCGREFYNVHRGRFRFHRMRNDIYGDDLGATEYCGTPGSE